MAPYDIEEEIEDFEVVEEIDEVIEEVIEEVVEVAEEVIEEVIEAVVEVAEEVIEEVVEEVVEEELSFIHSPLIELQVNSEQFLDCPLHSPYAHVVFRRHISEELHGVPSGRFTSTQPMLETHFGL